MEDETLYLDQQSEPGDVYEAAGFWMRFWAYLTDGIVVFSLNGVILQLATLIKAEQLMISYWTLSSIIAAITFFVYFSVMTKVYGQTIGKMIFGIKVIHEDETADLSWSDIIFREVIGRFIYKSFILLNLLYVVVAFNKDKQGIHDLFGETRVVHTVK